MDFAELEAQDATGATYFVVGGRAYFEAQVFGPSNVATFTT